VEKINRKTSFINIIIISRYMSKFREQVKLEKEVNKSPNKTMGPAKVDVPLATNYLQKHSKEPKLPESTCPSCPSV